MAFIKGPKALIYTHNGVSLTAKEWAERLGITRIAFYHRLALHGNDPKIFGAGVQKSGFFRRKQITICGVSKSWREWEAQTGLRRPCIIARIAKFGRDDQRVLHPGRFRHGRRYVTFQGRTLCHAGWAKVCGVSRERIRQRLNKFTVDEALGRYVGEMDLKEVDRLKKEFGES